MGGEEPTIFRPTIGWGGANNYLHKTRGDLGGGGHPSENTDFGGDNTGEEPTKEIGAV